MGLSEMFGLKTGQKVTTGCKDCGGRFSHYPPDTANYPRLERKYSGKDIVVYECPTDLREKDRHYAVLIRSISQDKMFFTCGANVAGITSEDEIKRILEWAGSTDTE